MPKKFVTTAVVWTVLAMILAGCNMPNGSASTDPGAFYTQAASTIIAEITYAKVETEVAQKTQEALVSPTPTLTSTPMATATPTVEPTATDKPKPPTDTPEPTPCNALQFISDITIEDGEIMSPNEDFHKVWRIQNVGTCTWTSDYDLVFVDGDQMSGDKVVSLTNNVSPGRSIDVGVYLTAPSRKGTYTGYWMLRSSGGSYFGWGADADQAFYVTINVKTSSSSDDDDDDDDIHDTPFYFTKNICLGDWYNEDDDLPCPGDPDSGDGSAIYVKNPWLEKGGKDDEPAIVVQPQQIKNGKITGKIGKIEIDSGDTFYTAIGCMKDMEDCDVNFILKVRNEDGDIDTLGTWNEEYDKKVTPISIDLSAYDGEDLTFYFIVEANGSSKDDTVFWLNPQIR